MHNWASLSNPHIDQTNGQCMGNNLSQDLCIIYPAFVTPLVSKICVHSEMLCVFLYIDVLHVCDCQDM